MTRPLVVGALIVVLAVAAVITWNTATRDREYQRLIAAGDAAVAGDQTFLAIESYSGAVALKRDSMLAYLKRGETYRRHGDLEAALRDLRTASSLDPSAPRPLEQLGDVQYALRRYERAADRYAAYVRLDDRSPRVLYKLALARFSDGNSAAAIAPLRQAILLNDRFPEANYLLGLVLWRQRQTGEAIRTLQRASLIDPSFAPAHEALADLFAELNRPGEQLQQIEALISLEPDRPNRYLQLGLAHAARGRPDLAVAAIGRAAGRDADNRQVYAALAGVWLDVAEAQGDHVALGKAQRALRVLFARGVPTGNELLLQGRALLLRGDVEAAFRVLREATLHTPIEPLAFLRLAQAAERLHRRDDAKAALTSYAALVPDEREQASAALRIARLGIEN